MQASYLEACDPKRKAPNLFWQRTSPLKMGVGPGMGRPMGNSPGATAQRTWRGPLGATHVGQDAEEIQTCIHAITKLHHPTKEKEKVERRDLHIV